MNLDPSALEMQLTIEAVVNALFEETDTQPKKYIYLEKQSYIYLEKKSKAQVICDYARLGHVIAPWLRVSHVSKRQRQGWKRTARESFLLRPCRACGPLLMPASFLIPGKSYIFVRYIHRTSIPLLVFVQFGWFTPLS